MLDFMPPPTQLPRSPRTERRTVTSAQGKGSSLRSRPRSAGGPRGRRPARGLRTPSSSSSSQSLSPVAPRQQGKLPPNHPGWEIQLDSLLADLQGTIHTKGDYPGTSPKSSSPDRASPAYRQSPQNRSFENYRHNNSSLFSETVTESRRSAARGSSPSSSTPSRSQSRRANDSMQELDALLNDLNDASYMSDLTPKGDTSGTATVPPPPHFSTNGVVTNGTATSAPVQVHALQPITDPYFDEQDSAGQNAQTYESRTVTVTESVPEGYKSASSATQELDDLMASLSDFKILATSRHKTVVEEDNYAKPVKSQQLDSMLGNLQDDMNKQGITTAQKGVCAACDKPIVGQVITALGKTWHAEHFTCAHCKNELGNKSFFEREGRPYCETDYHNLFSPRCAYCNGPILDKCVTALEQTWHPEHFFCAQCGKPFGEDGFHEKDGKPYCKADYFDMFAPKCGGCCRPIMENYITALNTQWHPECFVCKDCQRSFESGSFFDFEGQPYCETHYHAKRGSLCAGCNKPITGRCITAMFRKFHPEHFVCSFCLKQLNKGTFKEQAEKPYCHDCFDKLFG